MGIASGILHPHQQVRLSARAVGLVEQDQSPGRRQLVKPLPPPSGAARVASPRARRFLSVVASARQTPAAVDGVRVTVAAFHALPPARGSRPREFVQPVSVTVWYCSSADGSDTSSTMSKKVGVRRLFERCAETRDQGGAAGRTNPTVSESMTSRPRPGSGPEIPLARACNERREHAVVGVGAAPLGERSAR